MTIAPPSRTGERSPWDELPGMVQLLEPDGAARYVNAVLAAFMGMSVEQALGHGWHAALYKILQVQ